jgi:hypothetical protein
VAPDLIPNKNWYVEVRTQFTNGTSLLKEVRTIQSEFMLAT